VLWYVVPYTDDALSERLPTPPCRSVRVLYDTVTGWGVPFVTPTVAGPVQLYTGSVHVTARSYVTELAVPVSVTVNGAVVSAAARTVIPWLTGVTETVRVSGTTFIDPLSDVPVALAESVTVPVVPGLPLLKLTVTIEYEPCVTATVDGALQERPGQLTPSVYVASALPLSDTLNWYDVSIGWLTVTLLPSGVTDTVYVGGVYTVMLAAAWSVSVVPLDGFKSTVMLSVPVPDGAVQLTVSVAVPPPDATYTA
jgi:hypothetical protein